ncbi:hypothetical protein PVMG_04961 [Plasmodium vivax Mauritania I]|uniref:Uncharacterized protein n=1 Tax=Plasmodium vivax Mauritania I TaxID=1035515 RepID=A0A0J9TCJ9_PLAVI|nr:hypothetical protein PVMG_04961 [Plasmodium vivax Mauritania I]
MNNPAEVVAAHLRRTGNSNEIRQASHVESVGGSANSSLDDDDGGGYDSAAPPGELHTTGDAPPGEFRTTGVVPPGRQKGGKKRMFKIKKKKSLTPLHIDDGGFTQGGEAKGPDVALESFAITRKRRRPPLLGRGVVESSNIELTSKLAGKLGSKLGGKLNPTLSLVASRAVDGLLGGVHKHMQGPFSLDLDGTNNSPLATPIVTPNLYSNISTPFNMHNGIPPSAPAPMALPPQGVQVPLPNAQPQPPPSVATTATAAPAATSPMASPTTPTPAASTGVPPPPGIQLATNAMTYPQMNMQNVMTANQMAQNPAFNIHPTATNLRDDPGNVNYNEVVTITIGIVICLFLFCFVFGCIVKMCKPAKRRR